MQRKQLALSYFNQGYNCAQSVAMAYADKLHMDPDTAAAAVCGLGGGIGRLRDNCGTFSIAVMLCGAAVPGAHLPESRGAVYTKVQHIHKVFLERLGSVNCADLLGKPRGAEPPVPEARTATYYSVRPCQRIVETACDIIDQELFPTQE